MSGSVRGLIVTLGLLPQQKVRYGLYSTKTNKVVYSALKYAVRKHHESAVNIYTSLNNNLT